MDQNKTKHFIEKEPVATGHLQSAILLVLFLTTFLGNVTTIVKNRRKARYVKVPVLGGIHRVAVSRGLKRRQTSLIFSLYIADCFVALFCMMPNALLPYLQAKKKNYIFTEQNFSQNSTINDQYEIYDSNQIISICLKFFRVFAISSSVFLIVGIAMDRILMVIFRITSLTARKCMTHRSGIIRAGCWILSFLLAIIQVT